MNILGIVVGALIVVGLIALMSLMNRGNSACGGNCSTCVMREHCEKVDQH